jgi:hypothetical protein
MSNRTRKQIKNAPKPEKLIRQPYVSRQEVARIAERVAHVERITKYFTNNFGPINIGVTLTLIDLTLIPQGNAQGQRIADTIELLSIDGIITMIGANADVYNRTRMNIFTWHELSSTPPNLGALYQTPTTFPGTSTALNFENRQLYTNHLERNFVNVGTATNPTPTSVVEWKFHHKFKRGHKLAYGLANLQGTDHVFLGIFGDSLIAPFADADGRVTVKYV